MTKRIFLCILIAACTGKLYPQSSGGIQLIYEYTNLGLGEKRTATLLVRGNESLTIFSQKDSIENNEEVKDFDLSGDDAIGRRVYKNAGSKRIVFRDFVSVDGKFESCIVDEDLPPLVWTFKNEEKKIGPYNCRLASVDFRGRSYTAWYSEDLPITHGPWKFHGLPGGIAEIYSADKNISFSLKKVQSVKDARIQVPTEGKKISMTEYVEVKESSVKDFLKSLASKLPRGAQIDLSSVKDYNMEIDFRDVKR
jgi:GLPGLI family protein